MKMVNRKIATFTLMAAMFFNPLGYDIIFAMIMNVTGSYLITTGIFYLVSAFFFGLYFCFLGINPIKHIRNKIRKVLRK